MTLKWMDKLRQIPEMIEDPEPYDTIREIIERRLKIGHDDCLITVMSVAKQTVKVLEQQSNYHTSKLMCKRVLKVLTEYYITLWSYRGRTGTKYREYSVPPCLHIYRVRRWI